MNSLNVIKKALRRSASREKARILQRFFKTGPGEYAEGDKFIGVKVPDTRKIAREHQYLKVKDLLVLLKSRVHEERLLSLLILISQFEKANEQGKAGIYRLYLHNTRNINNWDLVDLSAPQIVGAYLADKDKKPLYRLARSKSLWERRIAIIATFNFIKDNDFKETLILAEMLLGDKEDLIHKAVGWMLREVGKREQEKLERFLNGYTPQMPRTMLRYAIERFSERKKSHYLTIPRAK
ncbi:MAG: DNA alkylation repair protein [Candidatus Omnitrophica bacterium]|nr:DNA alkylation repair protein [Candidatus Omnitrophota bacterium]